jgi:hypothetical protein
MNPWFRFGRYRTEGNLTADGSGGLVSLELPGWVADAFNLVGLPWPGIDEDQLRAWARDLREYAAEIMSLSSRSKSAVAAVAAQDESAFARTLASEWDHYHGVISDLREPTEVFASALDVAADAVVAQKMVVIGAAVALAGEVIATQGEALFTFGLAEAEVPVEVAATRLIVRGALQVLEGELLGALINKAATMAGDALGGAVGKLITGGGQVASEAVVLKADYNALETLASGLTTRGSQVEKASDVSWHRATSRPLETGGPGGGWREVARAVEQAVLRVLSAAFKDLGRALHTILQDTIQFLRKAVTNLRHTDTDLAASAGREAENGRNPGGSHQSVPRPGQSGGTIRSPSDGSARAWDREEKWAADAYDAIRSSDDAADMAGHLSETPRVGGGTGFTADEIQAIKDHVFFEEHPLDAYDEEVVISRYAPDADMAEAWLRVRSGRFTPQDVTLLEHELAEHNYYVSNPGSTYSEAHAAANQVANWSINKSPFTGEDYTQAWK